MDIASSAGPTAWHSLRRWRLEAPDTVAPKTVERFPDGEVYVHLEETVRGRDVYILQSTGPPVHEHLMELLITIDTFRRAAAGRITAIIPYYGYSRQEKMSTGPRADNRPARG